MSPEELAKMPMSAMTYREWLLGMVTAQGTARSGNTTQAARISVEYVNALISESAAAWHGEGTDAKKP